MDSSIAPDLSPACFAIPPPAAEKGSNACLAPRLLNSVLCSGVMDLSSSILFLVNFAASIPKPAAVIPAPIGVKALPNLPKLKILCAVGLLVIFFKFSLNKPGKDNSKPTKGSTTASATFSPDCILLLIWLAAKAVPANGVPNVLNALPNNCLPGLVPTAKAPAVPAPANFALSNKLDASKKKSKTDGTIDFINGNKMFLSDSIYNHQPKVGDVILFPNYLMHTAYPFKSSGERRSFSFNLEIDSKIANVFSR